MRTCLTCGEPLPDWYGHKRPIRPRFVCRACRAEEKARHARAKVETIAAGGDPEEWGALAGALRGGYGDE